MSLSGATDDRHHPLPEVSFTVRSMLSVSLSIHLVSHFIQSANLAMYSSLEIGQQVHWCRGCFSDWGVNQWLCGTCFQEELKHDEQEKQELTETSENQQEDPNERHKHDFVKALILETPNGSDFRKESFWCRICKTCM